MNEPDITDTIAVFQMPSTVYYMWCGDKKFKFQHYLGLLSAIRLLHPLKIIFYYTNPPVLDERWYYTWFQVSNCRFCLFECFMVRGEKGGGREKGEGGRIWPGQSQELHHCIPSVAFFSGAEAVVP